MKKRMLGQFVCVCLLPMLVSSASGVWLNFWPPYNGSEANWNDAAAWSYWDNGWQPGWVPTANDYAQVNGKRLIVDTNAVCMGLAGPGHASWATGVVMDILNGGYLEVKTTGWDELAHIGYQGEGTLNVYTGGAVHVRANPNTWQGGVTRIGGPGSKALLHMQGGTWTSDNALTLDEFNEANASAKLQLDAGIVNAGWLVIGNGGKIDITNGILQLRTTGVDVAGLVAAGKITAFGGTGTVVIDYNSIPGWTVVSALPEPSTILILGLGCIFFKKNKTRFSIIF